MLTKRKVYIGSLKSNERRQASRVCIMYAMDYLWDNDTGLGVCVLQAVNVGEADVPVDTDLA